MAIQITEVKVPVISALIRKVGQMTGLHKKTRNEILNALVRMEKVDEDHYRKRINLCWEEPESDDTVLDMLIWAFDFGESAEGREFWDKMIERIQIAEIKKAERD